MIPLRKLSRFFGISDRKPPPAAPRGGGGECHVYYLGAEDYNLVEHSQLLPKLNLDLLVRCVQIPSRLEAMKAFRAGLS